MAPSERTPFCDKVTLEYYNDEQILDDLDMYPSNSDTVSTVYSAPLSTPRRPITDVMYTSNARRRLFSDCIEQGKYISYYALTLLIFVLGTSHIRIRLFILRLLYYFHCFRRR